MLNLLDYSENSNQKTVTVYEKVATFKDHIELTCPVTVRPGMFFTCVADIPLGKDITMQVKQMDDVSGSNNVETTFFSIPSTTFREFK